MSWICKTSALIYVELWVKFSFKTQALRVKKYQNFFLRELSSVCRLWNIYWSAPIPRNVPCPEKFLVAPHLKDFLLDKLQPLCLRNFKSNLVENICLKKVFKKTVGWLNFSVIFFLLLLQCCKFEAWKAIMFTSLYQY